jgi:predicted kinase
MRTPLLIIVTGAPATAKTTVGRHVAAALRLPFLHKDGFKEQLFESLGWGDRALSKKLSVASLDLLYYVVARHLEAGHSLVVEANFHPRFATGRLRALREKIPFEPYQIVCRSDVDVLALRYRRRARSEARHPGHLDGLLLQELDPVREVAKYGALEIGGPVVQLDTTDPGSVDIEGLVRQIASRLEGGS